MSQNAIVDSGKCRLKDTSVLTSAHADFSFSTGAALAGEANRSATIDEAIAIICADVFAPPNFIV